MKMKNAMYTQNDFEVALKCVMKIHIMEILNCNVHYNITEWSYISC